MTTILETIRKVQGGYRLVSKKTGRNLGTYDTIEGAKKRERQVQYFKHMNEDGAGGVGGAAGAGAPANAVGGGHVAGLGVGPQGEPPGPKSVLARLRRKKPLMTGIQEKWSKDYKKSIDCDNPKGFSQKAHCAGRKARQEGRKTKSDPVNEEVTNQEYFAGNPVFKVSDDYYHKCYHGKKKFHKYEKYVGNDAYGEAIRQYGRKNYSKPIVIQNETTGAMLYLRYGKKG